MALVDLKRTASDNVESETMLSSEVEQEDYPWGLQIDLGDNELQKLGVAELEVGAEFEVTVRVRVKSFSESSNDDTGASKSATLLIKEMSSLEGGAEGKSVAERIFDINNNQ